MEGKGSPSNFRVNNERHLFTEGGCRHQSDPGYLADGVSVEIGEGHGLANLVPNLLSIYFGGRTFCIGLALLIECYRKSNGLTGLGLAGAIAINLCGGFILAIWLLYGNLNLPMRGQILIWGLVLLLVGLSLVEGLAQIKMRNEK
jgi:hypothetical protein